MISYNPFYETLLKKNMTEYALIFKQGIPANTLHRMKHGQPITTKTLDNLCSILNCGVSDILEYTPDGGFIQAYYCLFSLYLQTMAFRHC